MESLREWFVLRKNGIIFAATIFLISSLSFALGYMANREFDHAPIIIEEQCRSG
jgi:hypothetical protein